MYPDPYGSPSPPMPPPTGEPADVPWPAPAPDVPPRMSPPPYAPPPGYGPPPGPVPMHPAPGAAPRAGRTPGARVVVAAIVTLALVALGAAVGSAAFDDSPVYPKQWDRRVADIARFVEQHRGHRFKHPVQIYFLSPDRYTEIAGGGPGRLEPTTQERKQAQQQVAAYRALGLMQGDPDLFASNETLQDSGTLAFYSPEDDVVNVRGTTMTPGLRVTLAHELTHALQDQYFDLTPRMGSNDADRAVALRAVIEGDAVAVENDFVATLSDADRSAYETENTEGRDEATTDLADVPAILKVLFSSYYAVGNAFVEFLRADQSGSPRPTNIDEVLRNPPDGSSQLFEAASYLDDVRRTDVDPPDSRGLVIDRGVHGVDLLYLMLAERIDPLTALTATDGWRGDAYTASVGRDGKVCVVSTVRFATDADAGEFSDALAAWSATMPTDPERTISPDADSDSPTVTLTSCDPGASADMGLTGKAGPALGYPVVRLQAAASAVSKGRSRANALCYGEETIRHLTLDDLQATERTPAIEAALAAADAACP